MSAALDARDPLEDARISTSQRRVLSWVRGVVAGETTRFDELDDGVVRTLIAWRLESLAVAHGARHPELQRSFRLGYAAVLGIESLSAHLLEALASAGVKAVTLKGPALGAAFWGGAFLRPSTDVDVLVSRDQLDKAVAALKGIGCQVVPEYPDWYLRGWYYSLRVLPPPGFGGAIELHWNFVKPYLAHYRVDDLLASRVSVLCETTTIPAADPVWQLVSVAPHAEHHCFDVRSLLDIAFIARSLDERQWPAAILTAREADLGPALYNACTVSARWLDWRLPDCLRAARPPVWRDPFVAAHQRLLPVIARPGWLGVQAIKPLVGLVTTGRGWGRAVAMSVLDRPRVATRRISGRSSAAGRKTGR